MDNKEIERRIKQLEEIVTLQNDSLLSLGNAVKNLKDIVESLMQDKAK